jgi:hypothetical protein
MSQEDEEGCQYLKNIQYKTMLMNGKNTNLSSTGDTDTANIDRLLEEEMKQNKNLSWPRLDRSDKILKLHDYAEKYCQNNTHNCTEVNALKEYLVVCLDRNRLEKVREVKYNKETEEIEAIQCLLYNKTHNRFTLKRCEKQKSTLTSLNTGNLTRKSRNT